MNKLSNIFKIIFHFLNIILIFIYLFPASILGWFFYRDLNIQPQFTNDFIKISSNHFYCKKPGPLGYLPQQPLNNSELLQISPCQLI